MLPETKNFIGQQFREYYSHNPLQLPDRFLEREWGLIPDDGKMRRHIGFGGVGELNDYMKATYPSHLYYSVAYYRYPSAPTMQEKEWQGADLIFDLDADHLPSKANSYAEMLAMVKGVTMRLFDEFLIDEMGFSKSDIEIVFSGGRGYHIHVMDKRLQKLGSPERREIVDYITGTGLDIKDMFETVSNVTGDSRVEKASRVWHIRNYDTGGWKRRVGIHLHDRLSLISSMEEPAAVKALSNYGLGRKRAMDLVAYSKKPENMKLLLDEGKLRLGDSGLNEFFNELLKKDFDYFVKKYGCGIDEPVTSDIKRLIRVPGSLHGKSSLRVVSLSREAFETFEPLRDATYFGDDLVGARVLAPQTVTLKGKTYKLTAGTGMLPLHLAMFLFCGGQAEYVMSV